MKQQFNFKKALILCFTLFSFSAYSQTAGTAVLMEIKNITQPNDHQIEYEVWLTNTGITALALRGNSWGINHTPGLGNGGTMTHTFVSRDPSLATIPTPTGSYSAAINHLRMSTTNCCAGIEVPIMFGVPVRLATMRISTTTNFTDHGANYNPFNPPSPLNPMQVTTQAGRTQCIATCFVNYSYPAQANYILYGVGNAPTVASLNVLTGSISTSPLLNTASTLNLTCFIEGYWNGNYSMASVLANQSLAANPNDCDMINVELHEALPPYNLVASTQTMLHQNGSATCIFPFVIGDFYIVVKHRNAIETWSANPIAMGFNSTSYNFSNDANKAYGNNMKEVSASVWAFYSGDSYKDLNIDLLDVDQVRHDVLLFSYGNFDTDMNGDGNVDLLDSDFVNRNNNNFVYSMTP